MLRFSAAALALGLAPLAASAEELWKTLPEPAARPDPKDEGRVEVGGASIYYAIFGSGPPVILLHGGFGSGEDWGSEIPALTGRVRVIAVDSRGQGRSTRGSAPLSYATMAGDVIAVMDHLGIGQAAIIGWSDGAIVGLHLAIHQPDRVERLFAFAANFDGSASVPGGSRSATFKTYFARARRRHQAISPAPRDADKVQDALRKMWAKEPRYKAAELAKIRALTWVVDGERDEIISAAHTKALAAKIKGSKLLILPGLSHFALWQDPETFSQAMLDFLSAPAP